MSETGLAQGTEGRRRRLTTWAAIGQYIGRDARTAQRYEAERGLPVHRMPGGSKSTVYALNHELDAWLADRALPGLDHLALDPEPPHIAEGPKKNSVRYILLAIVAAGCLVVVLGLGRSIGPRQRQPVAPAAIEAYRAGEYAWQKRTPADLHRAVDAFTRSIVADPDFAPGYIGLADCYNLLPEFGDMSPADAYPRAQAAAERAVALDGSSAAAHRALAFSLFWWGADRDRAFKEFRTSIKLDPNSAQTRHWYANALAAMLDPAARTEIARAEELDATSTPIKADAGWIDYMLGRFNEAITRLDEVAAVDPGFSTTFRYRAAAKRAIGDFPGMLTDLRREGELGGNRDLSRDADSASLALRSGGPSAMFTALARNEEAMFSQGQFAAGRLAADELLAGHQDRALELLALAQGRHEWFASVITNPVFAPLRSRPGFQKLLRP